MSDRPLIDEADLMRRIARRDQDAFETLYDRHAQMVQRMARRILDYDEQAAEEVVQDVFFQIWRWPEKWDPDKGTFVNWLLTVARHTAIDHRRRRQRSVSLYEDAIEHQTGSNNVEKQSTDHLLLRHLLRKLPHEQRQAVVLAFLHGMTHQDIARKLDIPVGTAKSRLRLGLQKLRKAWMTQKKEH